MSVFFTRLGKFSAIISSNKLSVPFSLSSFSDSYNMNVTTMWCCPQSLLNSPHFKNYFFFCCSNCMVSTAMSSSLLISSSLSSNLMLIPSSVFFTSVIVFFPICSFVYFLSLCWNSHCVHPFILYDHYSMIITLNSLSVDYISPFCSIIFLRFSLVLSVEHIPVSPHFF